MANAGYSLITTIADLTSAPADFIQGGNNSVLDAIEINMDKNLYGSFAGKTRSSSAYARSTGNYKGITNYGTSEESYGQLKALNDTYGTGVDYSDTKKYESAWKQEDKEDPILTLLKDCEVQAIEGEGHNAIAVYVTGMSDPTLLSFASIFTDKDEDLVKALQDMMEGKNTAVGDQKTLLTYAQQSTSTTEKASSNTGEKSKSSNATKDK